MSDIEVGEVFTLSDENNEEQEVEVLGAMDVEGAEYIAVAFVEDIQTETEEDIDIFFLKVEEDSEFSYIENDEEFEKYLLRLKRFWMSKSKNRMKHTRTDAYPPSLFFTHPKIYAAIPVHLSSQKDRLFTCSANSETRRSVLTLSTGCSPEALSAESITAFVPSSTA